jgi:hypothetical protein
VQRDGIITLDPAVQKKYPYGEIGNSAEENDRRDNAVFPIWFQKQ